MKSLPLIPLQIIRGSESETIEVEVGSNLREVLLANGYSPYTRLTQQFNCGGRGLCATCGVWILQTEPAPTHWHDRLAKQFGYPRLSCQISINEPMTVSILMDKVIWGKRIPPNKNRSE
ncbi:MAG: 2Fe-2S iron-sulfur cluster-binding protein [Bacteroidota bacterium]